MKSPSTPEKNPGAFPDWVYLSHDFLGPHDGSVKLRRVKMVKARSSHFCDEGAGAYGDSHKIKPGERYRLETALVDGDYFGKYKTCISCMDRILRDDFGLDPDNIYKHAAY